MLVLQVLVLAPTRELAKQVEHLFDVSNIFFSFMILTS